MPMPTGSPSSPTRDSPNSPGTDRAHPEHEDDATQEQPLQLGALDVPRATHAGRQSEITASGMPTQEQ